MHAATLGAGRAGAASGAGHFLSTAPRPASLSLHERRYVLTILWAIGITAEGMTGALAAGRERMDLFGVIMVALVTALGGGSIRDVLFGHYPLTWVRDPEYVLLVVLAAVITISIAGIMKYFRQLFLALDGLGLVVFSILGAQVALDMELGIIIAVVGAVVTGVAGGIMRDLFCDRIPLVFREELYASVSVIAALLFMGLLEVGVAHNAAVAVTLAVGFALRMLAIKFRWRLPVFEYQDSAVDGRKALRKVALSLRSLRLLRLQDRRPVIDD
ncbi:trimeric intracellular cation channel family protein [Tessaracoccus sp. ZS01]|nr:trimeric intracellular cation channel family protein [Tessaracoccus sp. ZS01]MCG6566466.1 trimeric intracellular cation channel family protein [Tessaracoccus sp. ZS01]